MTGCRPLVVNFQLGICQRVHTPVHLPGLRAFMLRAITKAEDNFKVRMASNVVTFGAEPVPSGASGTVTDLVKAVREVRVSCRWPSSPGTCK